MATNILLFILGFTSVTTVYEIAKSGKHTKSDKISRAADSLKKKKISTCPMGKTLRSIEKRTGGERGMNRELNQYILKEYTRLHSVMEQREFVEKMRFLMMAGEKEFSCYYSDTSLPVREFYSVADTLYSLNNLWMLSGFLHKNRHILFEEIREREEMRQEHDFTEICNFGKDVILSRMLQVMENFRIDGKIVNEDTDNNMGIHRIRAYCVAANSGKNVPQFIIQGNWVAQCGFEIGCSVRVECYPNKLVILKE